MLLIILIVVYLIIAFSMIISLLLYGVRPSKTLAWLLAIFTIPVGGVLLYLLLGRNRRKNKLYGLKKEFFNGLPRIKMENFPELGGNEKLSKLIAHTTGCTITSVNDLSILKDGKETFESIFNALEEASHHIHIQYYIFEEGELAERLLQLFERKVKENVTVRLLYDGVGSYSLSRSYIKRLKAAGVAVEQFLPFRFSKFLASLNYRNHRKIIVVDNRVGFTGGINISDKYLKGDPSLGSWHDTHIKITGEATEFLNRIFLADWYLASGQKVQTSTTLLPKSTGMGNTLIQIVPSGPDDDFAIMEQVYFSMINQAKEYLYIINPYIIPNQAILQSLQTAALSGVDVRLLLSFSTDIKVVDWCVRAYFEGYLKAGIKVYLQPDGFLHSKIIVSDDTLASIGTANLDDRSLQQNYEVNAIIYDPSISKALKDNFLKDCSRSIQLDYAQHQQRKWPERILEGTAKLLSPLL